VHRVPKAVGERQRPFEEAASAGNLQQAVPDRGPAGQQRPQLYPIHAGLAEHQGRQAGRQVRLRVRMQRPKDAGQALVLLGESGQQ